WARHGVHGARAVRDPRGARAFAAVRDGARRRVRDRRELRLPLTRLALPERRARRLPRGRRLDRRGRGRAALARRGRPRKPAPPAGDLAGAQARAPRRLGGPRAGRARGDRRHPAIRPRARLPARAHRVRLRRGCDRRGGFGGGGAARTPLARLTRRCIVRRVPSRTQERPMKLEGIHHVTCITGDAPGNVDFYARVLGLRMVKKTVNQDDPTVYHLFYADEKGSPGADITFFEYPGSPRGRAGAGMVHRIVFRVGSNEALTFWEERLTGEGVDVAMSGDSLVFDDPEGLGLELRAVQTSDEPLVAEHPEIPYELALQGFDGVRAYSADPERSRRLLEET